MQSPGIRRCGGSSAIWPRSERLENRSIIEKAKGRIMERDGLSEQQAYDFIRKLSLTKGVSMRRIAEIILMQTGS